MYGWIFGVLRLRFISWLQQKAVIMMSYEWGNSSPIGKTWLNKGDTWKIGETTDFRTRKNGTEIQNRYTQKWLNNNKLKYQPLQHSSNKSAKSSFQDFETSRIKKFEKQFGYKPAGNKCYH